MKSFRENPDGEENQQATRQHKREMFALKMQSNEIIDDCEICGLPLSILNESTICPRCQEADTLTK